MNKFLKSHIVLVSSALCLTTFLSFWALEKNSCFEVNISKKLNVKAGLCYSNKDK